MIHKGGEGIAADRMAGITGLGGQGKIGKPEGGDGLTKTCRPVRPIGLAPLEIIVERRIDRGDRQQGEEKKGRGAHRLLPTRVTLHPMTMAQPLNQFGGDRGKGQDFFAPMVLAEGLGGRLAA